MDRYEGTHGPLTIALHGGLYLEIKVDLYEGPNTTLTIVMHGGLYLAIMKGLTFPLL
jgi:hypothetical protein